MLKNLLIACFALLIIAPISCAKSGPDLNEGKWEITTSMEMPGMNMPPMKHTQCLTKKDMVPQSPNPDQKCKKIKTTIKGNTVSWVLECDAQGQKMTGTGTITYSGDSFEGSSTASMPTVNMKMTSKISGRRIGNCK